MILKIFQAFGAVPMFASAAAVRRNVIERGRSSAARVVIQVCDLLDQLMIPEKKPFALARRLASHCTVL
jgi:hypothetical protein